MSEPWRDDDDEEDDDRSRDHRGSRHGGVESFTVRHHRRARWLPWLIGVLLVALLATVVVFVWVQRQISPGRAGDPIAVSIPPDSSTARIAGILAKAGVIHSPTVFRYYTKLEGTGVLLPGNYQLARNSSYGSVISKLEKGPPIVYQKFTIPEGFTLAQIAARVGALPGRSPAKFMAAATSGQIRSQFQPPNQGLEGLLFPATYQVTADQDETAILTKMVSTFDENAINAGINDAATKLGITPYQVIIVASMVEREAKLNEDRGPIASVIYNRLKKNILLQIDATLLYGQGITEPSQIDKNSSNPYNTYKFKGLPPTPIASPGLPSLQAAANPPSTAFLYYVLSDASGKHAFATNAKDFDKLVADARAKGLL